VKLLKFKACSETNWEHTLEIIKGKKLYMAMPKQLNDPFDCAMPNIASETDLEFAGKMCLINHKQELRDLAQKEGENFSESDLIEKGKKDLRLEFERGIAQGKIEDLINKGFRILSLSKVENAKNALMWSHYAGQHNGVCFEFDSDSLFTEYNGQTTYPKYSEVDYPKEAGPISFFSVDVEERIRMLKTKSEDWGYENEIRYIYPVFNMDGKPRYLRFKNESLLSIRFGIKLEKCKRDVIIRACLSNGLVPKFIQMIKSPNGLYIDEKEILPSDAISIQS